MSEKFARRSLLLSSAALVSAGLLSLIANRSLSEPTRESLPPETATTHVASAKPEMQVPESDPSVQRAWFSQVQEGIREGEYNISRQEIAVDRGPGGLFAAKLAKNLRADEAHIAWLPSYMFGFHHSGVSSR